MTKGVEIVKSIWLGKTKISIGDTCIDGNEFGFRKLGGLPIFNKFLPVLANCENVPYQERDLFIPGQGTTGMKVRIYMADLTGDKYFAISNPQERAAIAHLQRENEALTSEIERLFTILYDASGEDRWKKRIKKEIENYNAIKGSYSYGGMQPGMGGVGFGGFGGMPMGGGMGGDENPPPEM